MLSNPDDYLVGRGPALSPEQKAAAIAASEKSKAAAKERAKSASVSTKENASAIVAGNFTVIPNVTPGFNSNFSFLRFPNFNADISTTATVQMIGDTTGRDYGTATVSSPPWSSPQLSVQNLLDTIDGGSFDPSDKTLTLYIQSSQFLTGIQHVYYNSNSDFFENMSVCSFPDGITYLPMTAGVVNVHTTTLFSRFPSVVKVHNKEPVDTTLRLRVYDGPTGNFLGIFGFNAAANSTYAFDSQVIEGAISRIPNAATDFHMNVMFDADPTVPPNAIISHTVTNVRVSGSVLNLTTICNIND